MSLVTIEAETWTRSISLTPEELAAWDNYSTTHEHLLSWNYEATLEMFLNHYRRGINLNLELCK